MTNSRIGTYRFRTGDYRVVFDLEDDNYYDYGCWPQKEYLSQMKREFSAGGIVFNDKGQVLVAKHSQNKHWSFPKGLVDPGQTIEEAALREVREEGGVVAEIIGKAGYSKYVYTFNKEKIFKVVTYFLMKYISGDPKDHDWEVSDIGWYEPEDALKQLSFSQDKELLKKALEIYGKRISIAV